MSRPLNACPLRTCVEQFAKYFARMSAANAILHSKPVSLELLAYDRWIAIHAGRCEQCNRAYLEASRNISERLKHAN